MSGLRQRPTWSVALLAALLMAPLAACGSLIPGAGGDPPRLFNLTPKSTFKEGLPEVNWQLIIESPVAAGGLNTSRIVIRKTPTSLEFYARVAWTETAPKMVQTLLIESFENSGKIVAVGRESAGLRSDFVLKTELREFQAEYFEPGPPKVRVRLIAKLVEMPERIIVATSAKEFVVTSKSNTLSDIVDAFDEALGKSLRRIVEWTLIAGRKKESPELKRRTRTKSRRRSATDRHRNRQD